jgi:hypothetical protein
MPYDDGRNGARARSARIRTGHDYEATQLEEMRRRTATLEQRPERVLLWTRLSVLFGRKPGHRADVGEAEAIASAAHAE